MDKYLGKTSLVVAVGLSQPVPTAMFPIQDDPDPCGKPRLGMLLALSLVRSSSATLGPAGIPAWNPGQILPRISLGSSFPPLNTSTKLIRARADPLEEGG